MLLYIGCKLGKPEYPYLSYGSSSERVRPSEASTCKREKLAPLHRQEPRGLISSDEWFGCFDIDRGDLGRVNNMEGSTPVQQ